MNDSVAPIDEIARLAYQIYEEEGRPEGKAAEHWARAERAIREQRVSIPPHHPEKPAEH